MMQLPSDTEKNHITQASSHTKTNGAQRLNQEVSSTPVSSTTDSSTAEERLKTGRAMLIHLLGQGTDAFAQQVRYVLMLSQLAPKARPTRPETHLDQIRQARMRLLKQALGYTTHADDTHIIRDFLLAHGDTLTRIEIEVPRLEERILAHKAANRGQNSAQSEQWQRLIDEIQPLWRKSQALTMTGDSVRAWYALIPLLKHIQPSEADIPTHLKKVLKLVRRIKSDDARIRAQAALMPHLAQHLQVSILEQLLGDLSKTNNQLLTTQTLIALVDHLPEVAFKSVIDMAQQITQTGDQARVLMAMLERIPPDQQNPLRLHILKIIDRIADEDERAEVLIQFAPHLDFAHANAEEFPPILESALSITILINKRATRARVLVALAPHLTLDLQGEALAAVHSLSDERERTRLLTKLAAVLPPDMLVASLAVAHTMREQDSRAQALAVLAHYINDSAHEQTLLDALAATTNLPHHFERVKALIALLDILPENLQEQAIANALEATRNIDNESARARALGLLGGHLSQALQRRALDIAYELSNGQKRLDAVLGLIEGTQMAQDEALIDRLLTTIHELPLDYKRARALTQITPYIAHSNFEAITDIADTLTDPIDHIQVYLTLIQHSPPAKRGKMVAHVWRLLQRVEDGYDRASIITSLATHLPPESRHDLLNLAVDSIHRVLDDYDKASVITLLAPLIGNANTADTAQQTMTDMQVLPDAQNLLKRAILVALTVPDATERRELVAQGLALWLETAPDAQQAYQLWRQISLRLINVPLTDCLALLGVLLPIFRLFGQDHAIIAIAHLMGVR